MAGEGSGVWVYAVTREPPPDGLAEVLSGSAGVDRETVRMVRHAGLAAVVGTVDLHRFGEQALRHNLEDLDWLAATARTHDAVVAAVARCGATVPLRLATVYGDDERVRGMLAARRADLDEALVRVTGRSERGVKAYGDRTALAFPVEATAPAGGAGTAYLRRRRAQLSADEEVERRAAAAADRIHAALAAFSTAARRYPPQSSRLSGKREWMLLNGAYLVDDERAGEFVDAVAAQEMAHRGIRLELTGPWPPYSFAAAVETDR
jgi:hypothetical protein